MKLPKIDNFRFFPFKVGYKIFAEKYEKRFSGTSDHPEHFIFYEFFCQINTYLSNGTTKPLLGLFNKFVKFKSLMALRDLFRWSKNSQKNIFVIGSHRSTRSDLLVMTFRKSCRFGPLYPLRRIWTVLKWLWGVTVRFLPQMPSIKLLLYYCLSPIPLKASYTDFVTVL